MRTGLTGLALAVGCAAPAAAQESAAADGYETASLAEARPGSPSNATATVSPSTVPQNMDRPGAGASGFTLSLGGLYARGDFGADTDTTIVSTALAARYQTGGLRLTASLPWMRIRSRGTLFTGIDSTPVLVATGSGGPRRTSDGLGDLTLGAAYALPAGRSGTEVELSGRVKLDTATRGSGLSSGRRDYALGVQVTQTAGRFAPFASATYRFLGDSAAFRLRDGFAASAGSSLMLGERSFLLASYHYSERATRLVRDAHELFLGASAALPNTRFRVTGFGTAGLSDGAAAVSGGVALSRSF